MEWIFALWSFGKLMKARRREGEHVGLGVIHQRGELGHLGAQLIGDHPPLLARGLGILLHEGGADEGGDDALALPPGLGQHVALDKPLGALLAVAGSGLPLDLKLHQALGGKPDHLAQQIGVAEFFSRSVRRVMISSVIAESSFGLKVEPTKPYRLFAMTTASRSLASARSKPRSLAACSAGLHYYRGTQPLLRSTKMR